MIAFAGVRPALDRAVAAAPEPTATNTRAAVHTAPRADPPPSRRARSVTAPAGTVRAYYAALDRRDFARAWGLLSPTVQASFGGFDRWRDGFATTVSSRPVALRIERTGTERVVVHELEARDRADCGVLVRRFAVRWRLERTAAGWQAAALSGAPAAGPTCSAR